MKRYGPEDDDVREGQFEYIGEVMAIGSSHHRGNSAPIDTVTTPIPIYLFYKNETGRSREYQGPITDRDYRIEEHNERAAFIFGMEHTEDQSNAASSSPNGVTAVGIDD